ncbi:nucleotidyltransferase family protein [Candidatus Woesearchaeota archaeon]|nr:nucleotidyltransferase family protein [Candidatus Woesearchaeota archaeon]
MKITKEVHRVLRLIASKKIDYVVIRNFERILQNKPYQEKDVDILIGSDNKRKVIRLLSNQGFTKLLLCPSAGHYGFVKYTNGKFLSFHLHTGGVSGANIFYLDSNSIFERRKQVKEIYVPSKEDQILILLLHSFLDSHEIKQKYREKINSLLKKQLDWDYLNKKLIEQSNYAFSNKILGYLKTKKYKKLEKLRSKFRKQFYYYNLNRSLGILKTKIHMYFWAVYRLFRNAPLLSFIGMDGTGKTTMAKLLKYRLDNSLITNTLIYTGRGRNNLLPIQFFGRRYIRITNKPQKNNKKINFTNKNSIFTKIMHTLAAPIFAFDLFLRYWITIWPKRKTTQIVITDRYSTDILLMAHVPMFFKKIMFLFFPKPSLTIYLYNHPKELHKRKKEHPINDLYRQKKLFLNINKKVKSIKIKSDNVDKTLNKISKLMSDIFF